MSRSYFPQDLKSDNIMIRRVDQSIAIIDLDDGRMDYFYRDNSKAINIQDRTRSSAWQFEEGHAFYTIDRVLLAIWAGQYPAQIMVNFPKTCLTSFANLFISAATRINLKQFKS